MVGSKASNSQHKVAIGYIRVSTEEQAREGISLAAQAAKIQVYAELHGMTLAALVKDEGKSGKSLERQGIQRVLDFVAAGRVEAVLVYKLDRLSRRTQDILELVEHFERAGVALHSFQENLDTKSAVGRFVLRTLASLAEMERDLIIERTRDALTHKRQVGEWVGRVPFGFRLEGVQLVEDPDAQAKIIRVKRLRRQGISLREIAQRLSLSLGLVHRLLNDHSRRRKAKYLRAAGTRGVQKPVGS